MALTEERTEPETPPAAAWPKASVILETLGVVSAAATLFLWWLGSLPTHPHFDIGRVVFGNVPGAVQAVFYIGVSSAIWLTFHLFALRARNWQRGKPDRRTGRHHRRQLPGDARFRCRQAYRIVSRRVANAATDDAEE